MGSTKFKPAAKTEDDAFFSQFVNPANTQVNTEINVNKQDEVDKTIAEKSSSLSSAPAKSNKPIGNSNAVKTEDDSENENGTVPLKVTITEELDEALRLRVIYQKKPRGLSGHTRAALEAYLQPELEMIRKRREMEG